MLQSKIGRNFLICFIFLNFVLVGVFVYAVSGQPGLLSNVLPGRFGASASPDLSGNMLFLALLLLANAALFLIFGLGGTWHALWAGLRISPRKIRWLLHERAGLASDISGVVAAAVQEEEKDELAYLRRARRLLEVGLVLFALALPAVCVAYARAAPDGPAIFEKTGQIISNGTISQEVVLRFTVDQLAGALLLDIPEIFHLRATRVETNGANPLLGMLVLLYRTLIEFGVLLLLVGMRRASALTAYAMEVAMPVADIVAMEPALQDGHHDHAHGDHREQDHGSHDDHRHGDQSHSGHDDSAPADHSHIENGHSDHPTGDHNDQGHDDRPHDDRGHDDHGHDDHGHSDHHAKAEEHA